MSSYREDDMHKTIWRTLGSAGLALVLTASAVNAQDTVRVRGTIDRVEGPVYIVKSRDGSELKVSLADNAGVTAIVKASLSVGVAGMPASNSSLNHHRSDVRVAENGFATSSGVSKSAKVVLGCGLISA